MQRKELERNIKSYVYDVTTIKVVGVEVSTDHVVITAYSKLTAKQIKEQIEVEGVKVYEYNCIVEENRYKMSIETFVKNAEKVEIE